MDKLPHLRLEGTAEKINYTSTNAGGGKKFKTPVWNPSKHASDLKAGLETASNEAKTFRERERTTYTDLLQREPGGVVLTFESEKGHSLKLEGLEKLTAGIQLRSVQETDGIEKAKVFVPTTELPHFFKLIETYATRTVLTVDAKMANRAVLDALVDKKQKISVAVKERPGELVRATITCSVTEVERIKAAIGDKGTVSKNVRKNTPLIESIANVRLALVEDFWGENRPFPKSTGVMWWEVWLSATRSEAAEVYDRFRALATGLGFRISQRYVTFPERVVLLAYGSAQQFSLSLELLAMLAELRYAKELATPYVELPINDQKAFAEDLLGKVVPPPDNAPAVCILDAGVNRAHILLSTALAEADTQTIDVEWGTADHDRYQHGTGMAGIALFGCLTTAFMESGEVRLRHRLESVKFLPPPPKANDPEVYGAVTQEAVALAVIRNATRNRAICMAVTATSSDQGLPSSWSGAVDEMCAGVLDEMPKLMFISAGNVRDELFTNEYRYHEWNITRAGIEDPAQAWNALTVGAYTEKVVIQDPSFNDYEPLATAGDLTPTSRTSLAWPDEHHAGWPIKPDIVCEGGNYAAKGEDRTLVDDLSLLTTILHPSGRLLETTRDTSPATALAARMGAELWSHYPKLWPETVRGLLVHSARWTPAMMGRFGVKSKRDVQRCLRCYGYGVPDLDRAVYSLKNAATLIYEGEFQPFRLDAKKKQPVTNEMHLHSLPWPKERLLELGETPVTMRVTLSYFIEPSPGNVGWGTNHRYASHGLRFDVIRPLEELHIFKQRISRAEWDNPKDPKTRPQSQKETRDWVVGDDGRTHGSLHSDWWQGTAAELAACDSIAVYPVTGWWRERSHLGRLESMARYSLVISLQTPKVDADLYTPIENTGRVLTEVLN